MPIRHPRQDVPLDGGAALVLLREERGSYLRLLVPVDGRPTYVTRCVPLPTEHGVGLAERLPYRAELGELCVEVFEGVDGESRFQGKMTVAAAGRELVGRRMDLHQALWRW